MQPWKISAGLTAALMGSVLLLGGSRLEYLAPHWPLILARHGVPVALHTAFAVVTVAAAIYGVARATGLADLGSRVDLAERSRPARRRRPGPHRRAPQGRRRGLGVTRMNDRTSVEGLPANWRRQAKSLRRYGGETPAAALERCAADLEATSSRGTRPRSRSSRPRARAVTPPTISAALFATARSPTREGPARPGSHSGTCPGRPTSRASRDWRRSGDLVRFQMRRSCSPSSRRESNDGTHET